MNSKLLTILAIALMTMFLSAQAFACGGAKKDRDIGDQGKYAMYDNSGSEQGSLSDLDINKDQGNSEKNPTEPEESE